MEGKLKSYSDNGGWLIKMINLRDRSSNQWLLSFVLIHLLNNTNNGRLRIMTLEFETFNISGM